MATSQSTMDFLTDQLGGLSDIRYKKMFGEYALYYNGKVVALVCDDQLFIKPTDQGLLFIARRLFGDELKFEKLSESKKVKAIEDARTQVENPPYPGGKMWYLISGDLWDDREWMCGIVKLTASLVPYPKLKKKKPTIARV